MNKNEKKNLRAGIMKLQVPLEGGVRMSDSCEHWGSWSALHSVPIQVQGGALLVTPVYCTNCGHVEYRSPPVNSDDEKALQERMEELQRKEQLRNGVIEARGLKRVERNVQ